MRVRINKQSYVNLWRQNGIETGNTIGALKLVTYRELLKE